MIEWVAMIVVIAVAGLAGCSKSETGSPPADKPGTGAVSTATAAPAAPTDPADLSGVKKAFASADPKLQVVVEEAIGSARGRDYATALETFQMLGNNPKLTPQQKQAVQEAVLKLRGLTAGRSAR